MNYWLIFIWFVIFLAIYCFGYIHGVLSYKLRIRFAMRVMLPLAEWELKKLNESFKRGKLKYMRDYLKKGGSSIEIDDIKGISSGLYKNEIKLALHKRWELKEAIRRVLSV